MSSLSKAGVPDIPHTKRKMDKAKAKKYFFKYVVSLVRWIFILGMCFVVLYPLFSKIMISFMSIEDMYNASVRYIPQSFTLSNYLNAWTRFGGWETFLNTFILTLLCSLLQVISATLVGYGLARFKFRLNKLVFIMVIIALLLPPDLLFSPRYGIFLNLGLSMRGLFGEEFTMIGDTYIPMLAFAITCTGLKCSLYIFLMRQFFRGMPKELEEAAYVDGAGPLKTFIKIMLPGAVAMMVTVFLFSFVWQWLDTSYTTVFCKNIDLISTRFSDLSNSWVTDPSASTSAGASTALSTSLVKNAGIVIIIAPLIVLYAFTQRFFVESISRSGLVG